jgi:hypothetical protein
VIDDTAIFAEIGGVDAVLSPHQIEPEIHDLVDRLPDPELRGVHNRGVAHDRGHQGADVHLGISVPADEYPGGDIPARSRVSISVLVLERE